MSDQLIDIKNRTASVLKDNHAIEAYVFGSTVRGDDRANSDIDILVRFDKPRGLFAFVKTKLDLEQALDGRTVDLVHLDALRPEFRTRVESERVQIV
ncbi:MAG: nucleotidyltransferase family protein [Minisyncoccota bacterium]